MNKEPLQKALDAFESIFASTPPYTVDGACVLSDRSVLLMNEAMASIKLALAQPEDHFAGAGKAMGYGVRLVLSDIEQYRMQIAAISTAAFGYWKKGDPIHMDYWCGALGDVADLYKKYDELYQKINSPA